MIENFGRPVPAFDGIPVLLNDYLPGNETQGSSNVTCSIYAARFNEADGRGINGLRDIAAPYGVKGRGIHELISAILAAQNKGDPQPVQADANPDPDPEPVGSTPEADAAPEAAAEAPTE